MSNLITIETINTRLITAQEWKKDREEAVQKVQEELAEREGDLSKADQDVVELEEGLIAAGGEP